MRRWLSLVALVLVGCGGEPEDDGVGPGHEMDGDHFNFYFAHNPETLTYQKEISLSLDEECRMTLAADDDGDAEHERVWTAWCTDSELAEGMRVMARERLEIYEAESGSIEDDDRRCSLGMSLAPSGASRLLFFSNGEDYGPETEEMFAFFEELFTVHPQE